MCYFFVKSLKYWFPDCEIKQRHGRIAAGENSFPQQNCRQLLVNVKNCYLQGYPRPVVLLLYLNLYPG